MVFMVITDELLELGVWNLVWRQIITIYTNQSEMLNLRAGSGVRVPAEARNFSLHHCIRSGSGAHPTSYLMGIKGSL